ncbi:Copper transporter 4 [Vitis vinifera]|uniref:Copper transporter 4 n=1 Tax=Vitis vinifera TaxID=29760 RepID=A0A438HG54_VITVI|nr:Copper transporter 4 [Vitis vinifera]
MASSGGPMPVLPTEKAVAHTSFWVGTNVMVLFPGWPGNYSLLHYYLALLLVFVLALLTPICGMCSMPANEQMAPMTLLLYAMRHGLRKCLFYLVVLSVVTFNVGVFLAAIAGHVIGYFALSTLCLVINVLFASQNGSPPEKILHYKRSSDLIRIWISASSIKKLSHSKSVQGDRIHCPMLSFLVAQTKSLVPIENFPNGLLALLGLTATYGSRVGETEGVGKAMLAAIEGLLEVEIEPTCSATSTFGSPLKDGGYITINLFIASIRLITGLAEWPLLWEWSESSYPWEPLTSWNLGLSLIEQSLTVPF